MYASDWTTIKYNRYTEHNKTSNITSHVLNIVSAVYILNLVNDENVPYELKLYV